MADAREHARLRLSPEDTAIVWGILDAHRAKQTERWPRLERIIFDLEVFMAEGEKRDA